MGLCDSLWRIMKVSRLEFSLFLIVCTLHCGVHANAQSATATDPDAAAKQAWVDAAARQIWDESLLKCGDSYYEARQAGGFGSNSPAGLVQYKGAGFFTVSYLLTDADRLNGFQWVGRSIVAAKAWRVIYRDQSGVWGSWQDWKDGEKASYSLNDFQEGDAGVSLPPTTIEQVAKDDLILWNLNGVWYAARPQSETELPKIDGTTLTNVGPQLSLAKTMSLLPTCRSGTIRLPSAP